VVADCKKRGGKMGKKVVYAKLTDKSSGKVLVGKREIELYDSNATIDDDLIRRANVGLVLETQRKIRQKLKEKYGLVEKKEQVEETEAEEV